MSRGEKKLVLIAHQSTIPHYRVQFFNTVQRMKPDWWEFRVVVDSDQSSRKEFFEEPVDFSRFNFPTERTSTCVVHIHGTTLAMQSFVLRAKPYDLLVVEQAMNNLSYPAASLWRIWGKKVVYWGHWKDFKVRTPGTSKRSLESIKKSITRSADGFFAYTSRVGNLAVSEGCRPERVFSMDNTIDIERNRRAFTAALPGRADTRKQFGRPETRLLLYVGRLNWRKKFDFLIESLRFLRERKGDYRLIVVGSGDTSLVDRCRMRCGKESLAFLGPIVDTARLAPIFTCSDAYVYPGDVGLGPLEALCYDLPPVIIKAETHGPEIEYLNPENSLILAEGTTPSQYADAVHDLLQDRDRLGALKENAWKSISHLTISNMADNFIRGVNTVLANS